MQLDILYVGLFGLGLLAVGSGRHARWVVRGVLVAVVVIAGAGLISRLEPGWVASPATTPLDGYRLSYPLSYWNAFGGLAAFGGMLALGLSADPRSPVVLRALCAGAAVFLAVAMYLSFSRGAWLAAILGAVVLLALGAHRGSLLAALLVVGGATTLAVLRLRHYPGTVEGPTRGGGQAADGSAYFSQLAVLMAGAVVAMGVIAAGRASPRLMRAVRRVLRPIMIAVGGLLVLAALGTYVVRAAPIEGVADRSLRDASSWISRQWHDFLKPVSFSRTGTARLTTAKGTRSDLYRVAIDGFEHMPLRGDGAGSFQIRYMRTRRVGQDVVNAHSLPLETIGELGAIGALALITFLGAIIVAAAHSRRRPGSLPSAQTAAVGSACAVWIGATSVDWDWQMPAFSGLALLLAATLFPVGRSRRRRAGVALTSRP